MKKNADSRSNFHDWQRAIWLSLAELRRLAEGLRIYCVKIFNWASCYMFLFLLNTILRTVNIVYTKYQSSPCDLIEVQ